MQTKVIELTLEEQQQQQQQLNFLAMIGSLPTSLVQPWLAEAAACRLCLHWKHQPSALCTAASPSGRLPRISHTPAGSSVQPAVWLEVQIVPEAQLIASNDSRLQV